MRPFVLLFLLSLLLSGCGPKLSREEKDLRRELRQALRERSFEKAVQLAARGVGRSPQNNHAWESLVRAQVGLGELKTAGQTLDEWRAVVRRPSPALEELAGDVARKEGDWQRALSSWSKALGERPKSIRILAKVARAQRQQRLWQAEERTLGLMLATEENATTRMERALCRRRMRRWPEALEDFRRARELAPEDPDVRRGAKLFERLGKFLGEIRELEARLAVTPDDDQLLADRALLFLRSEDYELALADSETAAEKATWAMRPRLFQAIALIELGRADESDRAGLDPRLRLGALSPEFLETMSRLDAEISVERDNAELYVTRAWHLNEIGQPKPALADVESALRSDNKLAGAYVEGSYALTKLGRPEEAFAQIKRATELDANFSTAWHYRGELEMNRGDHASAIESLSRALAINQTAAGLQKREECYIKVGLLQKAEEDHRASEALKAHATGF